MVQSIITKYDIIALIETWHKKSNNHEFLIKGYTLYSFCRTHFNPRAKRGSGGISVYVKNHIANGVEVITHSEFSKIDDRVWLHLRKQFFGLERDVCIGIWYIPPHDSSRALQAHEMWLSFENEITLLQHNSDILVMGDFNARTGERIDWVEHDSIMNFPFSLDCVKDYKIGNRMSMDHTVNAAGQTLLDTCIATGLRILNGRNGKDSGTGKFTCNNYRGSSVVDYVLAEPQLFSVIKSFDIMGPYLYSDHCLLPFDINILQENNRSSTIHNSPSKNNERERYILDKSKFQHFQEEITSSRVLRHLKEKISKEEDQYHPQIVNDIIKSVGQNAGVLKRLKTQV